MQPTFKSKRCDLWCRPLIWNWYALGNWDTPFFGVASDGFKIRRHIITFGTAKLNIFWAIDQRARPFHMEDLFWRLHLFVPSSLCFDTRNPGDTGNFYRNTGPFFHIFQIQHQVQARVKSITCLIISYTNTYLDEQSFELLHVSGLFQAATFSCSGNIEMSEHRAFPILKQGADFTVKTRELEL